MIPQFNWPHRVVEVSTGDSVRGEVHTRSKRGWLSTLSKEEGNLNPPECWRDWLSYDVFTVILKGSGPEFLPSKEKEDTTPFGSSVVLPCVSSWLYDFSYQGRLEGLLSVVVDVGSLTR